jgi:HSP20 family molecular chaperone IbpA
MNCPNCNENIERGWKYCPMCGYRLERNLFGDLFNNIFSKMRKEMEEMDKLFERDFEIFDISPFFKRPRSSGFSIKIVRSGNQPPKINVKTFGDVDKEKIERQIENQLGIRRHPEEKAPIPASAPTPTPSVEKAIPKITEEPKTSVKRLDSKVVVEMEIPDVKSLDEIEIKELESSVEVKALIAEKAYFKILTKPPQFRLTHKTFHKGILHLEFS